MCASEIFYLGNFPEKLLPNTYTDQFPNDLPKYSCPSEAPFKKLFEFPITALVHSTHTEEKRSICQKQDGYARFKANPKLPKSTASRKLQYSNDEWKEYPIIEELLPGKYVWFSMKPTLPEDPEFRKADYNVCYVDGTSSYQYGPWSFTFDYRKLITTYKEHIENHSDPKKRDATVVLRNGGTLVYQDEICYVVIVTHSKDGTIYDNEYYPITQQYQDALDVPITEFHPKYIPLTRNGYSWDALKHYDHVAFAINCDWEGEYDTDKVSGDDDVVLLEKKMAPIFKITLPPGEPHCYFEDFKYVPNAGWTLRFHTICFRYGNTRACYSNEHKQWLMEMPKKIEEIQKNMKEIENEMHSISGHMLINTNPSVITKKTDRITELAKSACMVVKRTIEMFATNEKNLNIVDLKNIQEMIETMMVKIVDMTKSTEVARKAKEMAKMARDIADLSENKVEEDELAQKNEKMEQQKMEEALHKISEVQYIAKQIAEKSKEVAVKSVVMITIREIQRLGEKIVQSDDKKAAEKICEIQRLQTCVSQFDKDLKVILEQALKAADPC